MEKKNGTDSNWHFHRIYFKIAIRHGISVHNELRCILEKKE